MRLVQKYREANHLSSGLLSGALLFRHFKQQIAEDNFYTNNFDWRKKMA
jgi:hypothetical protein